MDGHIVYRKKKETQPDKYVLYLYLEAINSLFKIIFKNAFVTVMMVSARKSVTYIDGSRAVVV